MKKDEQANVLLSLKNLYRLFTVKDYPVYSTGILGEKSKKGLTLVRFWDEYLLYEWKSTRHGKMILTAEFDPLRDEGEEYGKRLKEANNYVEIHRIPDALHGYFALGIRFLHVQESFEIMYRFLNKS